MSFQANSYDRFVVVKSNNTAEATVNKLLNSLSSKGMAIFSTVDHQQGVIKSGLELRPTTLVIFGNPKVGTGLIQCDQRIGIDLSLIMLVWQDASGVSGLGYRTLGNLSKDFNLEGCEAPVAKVENATANFAKATTL